LSRLTIQGLSKAFGDVVAVHQVNLDVAEGEFVSLLGPSGCGKTTTLRCVAGLETPTTGRICFGDRDVTRLPPEKRLIGMVFQSYALFPHMTVAQNIGFGLDMRGVHGSEASRRIADVVEMVQLSGLDARYPRELSGGQQQRVALARALVIEPAMLLLDEPLANLDARLREEMRFFIRSLQQRLGITTLYVTHDQSESMIMSNRVVVMFGGCIHQIGSAVTSRDPMVIRPVLAVSSPAISRNVVDLPQPDGPSSATNSRSCTSSETLLRASTSRPRGGR